MNLRQQLVVNFVSVTQPGGTHRFQLPAELVAVGWKVRVEKYDDHIYLCFSLLLVLIGGG